MSVERPLTVLQMLPALHAGGVERGTLEIGRALVSAGHTSIVMSAGGRMLPQLLAEGSAHVDRNIGHKSPLTLRFIPYLRRFIREQRVDILHLRSRMPAWLGYLAWQGMHPATRPKLVTSVHGAYSVNPYSAVMMRGERVIAVSNTIKDYIVAHYPAINPAIIRTIHRGIDPNEFPFHFQPDAQWLARWRQDFPHLVGQQVLTLPGRITRWKGQLSFIDLIAHLVQRGIPVQGLIVGDADAKKQHFLREIHTKINQLNIKNNIILLGHRTDLKEIMSVSDMVFSLSSKPEAFGRTVPEALALGTPVVGYQHGGVGEVLGQWYPPGLIPAHDALTLQHRVAQLIHSPAPVPPQTDFTLAHMQSATLAVYRELLTA